MSTQFKFKWPAVVLAAAFAVAGCTTNQSGNIASTQTGDVSRPAVQGSPIAELQTACGATGKMTGPGLDIVRRQPYLQKLTTREVTIGWASTAEAGERVEVTTPDGAVVATAPAAVETLAFRGEGEHQLWADVKGLEADTIYCYALGNEAGLLSERIGFRTAPPADIDRTVRFLAFGDSGSGNSDQLALLEQMQAYPYEMMIHTGDLAYDNGTLSQIETTVFDIYADLFKHLAFFPVAGNHDYKSYDAAPFRSVFALPGDGGEKWYSFDWGPVHFAAIDTEADYGTQMSWLDADLSSTELRWKVVFLHRPPYSSGYHGSDTSLRTQLAPVLARHGVQLVLAGHDHNYERTLPQDGVVYIVTGGGGIGTKAVGTSSFTAFSEDVIHYLQIEVAGDEMVVHAIDGTGYEFDSVIVPAAR